MDAYQFDKLIFELQSVNTNLSTISDKIGDLLDKEDQEETNDESDEEQLEQEEEEKPTPALKPSPAAKNIRLEDVQHLSHGQRISREAMQLLAKSSPKMQRLEPADEIDEEVD